MTKTIVSLTTIPSREKYLPILMKSIEAQTCPPDRIELNVPPEYRRSDLGRLDLRSIPSGIDVFECEDLGPATKVLPTALRYQQEKVNIVYCDDDKVYDEKWLERLNETSKRNPHCAVCEEYFSVQWIERNISFAKRVSYGFNRLKFGKSFKSKLKSASPYVMCGFGGALIRPEMLVNSFAEIPKEVFFVDDVFLSGLVYANKFSITTTGRNADERSVGIEDKGEIVGERPDALKFLISEGSNRLDLNRTAIKYMRSTFGVF